MVAHGIALRPPFITLRALALLVLLTACLPLAALGQNTIGQEEVAGIDKKLRNAVENLTNIQESIKSKQGTVRELQRQLKQLEDAIERQEIEQKIERNRNEIAELELAFEQIVFGGVNLSILTEQPDQPLDWRTEIEQISRPLLSTLKELTARPRQMDSLRRDIVRREDQLEVIDKALDSILTFEQQPLTPMAAGEITRLRSEWEERRADTQRALEITSFKLLSLKDKREPWQTSIWEAVKEFFGGRGLTLLLATVAGVVIWLLAKGLLLLYWRWLYRSRQVIGLTRAPLVLYSYRLATAVAIVLAILLVFYIRGDVLLLTLAVIALAGAALSLRQTLPRYAAELRLLLGVGPVREEERLVLDGVPFLVESLGVYSVMRNPELEGVVRLPLHDMNAHASRPAGNEPWFPCRPGDYVLFPNGSLGRVLRQTIELVEVAVQDTVVQVGIKDFLSQNPRNLSRDGFGIASTFGVDYEHQAICLDTVPARFREAIIDRFEQVGLRDDIKDILVEFKAAGASSLDYQIYVVLGGRAGNAFFKAQRLIQQACVDTCNREGWVIPFTQITVHTEHEAEGSELRSGSAMSEAAGITHEPSTIPR